MKSGVTRSPHPSPCDLPLSTWRRQRPAGGDLIQGHTEPLPLLPSAHAATKAEAFPPQDSANPASCHHGLRGPGAKRLAPLPGLVPRAAVNTSLPRGRVLFVIGELSTAGAQAPSTLSEGPARASQAGGDVPGDRGCEEPGTGPRASKCHEM